MDRAASGRLVGRYLVEDFLDPATGACWFQRQDGRHRWQKIVDNRRGNGHGPLHSDL